MENNYGYFILLYGLFFSTEQAINDYMSDPKYGQQTDMPLLCAAISYTRGDDGSHVFKLHHHDYDNYNYQTIPSQLNYAVDRFISLIQRPAYTLYARQSYSYFQNWVANAVLRNESGIWTASISSLTVPMTSEPIEFDEFETVSKNIFPLLIVLMYIVPIHRLVMRIVTEKESLDIMKVMGLRESCYWTSWFLYFMSITTVIAIVATVITKSNVLPNSDGDLLFLFFWLYSLALFGYSVFMASFFSVPRTASQVSIFVYFITYFADYAVSN